jgi:hypothetical protein
VRSCQHGNEPSGSIKCREFKKGYLPRTNFVKGDDGNLLADSHSNLNRWKNFFCQILNVNVVNRFWQIEMHTAKQLAPEPTFF